jgi:hypothetical protein
MVVPRYQLRKIIRKEHSHVAQDKEPMDLISQRRTNYAPEIRCCLSKCCHCTHAPEDQRRCPGEELTFLLSTCRNHGSVDESHEPLLPKGYKVVMTVDGVKTAIKDGPYKGKIVLIVAKTA